MTDPIAEPLWKRVYKAIPPVPFTGTEIALGFAVAGPLLAKTVQVVGRLPYQKIQWPSRFNALKIFVASFAYAFYIFGESGLPQWVQRSNKGKMEPEASLPYFFENGAVVGTAKILHKEYGEDILVDSEQTGKITKADPINWVTDYAANVFFFSPMIAFALGKSVCGQNGSILSGGIVGFMKAGARVYWAPILAAARLSSVWAHEDRDVDIAFGRGLLFFITNGALALEANNLIGEVARRRVQIGVALLLTAATYYLTRPGGILNELGQGSSKVAEEVPQDDSIGSRLS